ncbi:hypothetical protein [Bacillus sp. KH172YL63]|uniref:hypothetical protein n=1 Tax=Bacillus sp. KH172YL63 TaxID=2709784 RepID=UPI0013E47AB3|nr:hypothetical protein [Bacillus sp. KH172YL63]BCB02179.1 hypothetical protein KH172YL63_03120 [Bacillus sp. KH172YL63]
MNLSTLKIEANRHKKFLENKALMNPYSYRVNNVDYFLVVYKRNEKFKGYAVIAEKEFCVNDAKAAFEKLIIYNVFVNRFFEIEEAKMKLSPDSFGNIAVILEQFLETNNNSVLLVGKDIIRKLEQLLTSLQNVIKDYSHYYDCKILEDNEIDDDEIEKLWRTLAHINREQYLQGRELIEKFDELRNMFNEMKIHGLDKELSQYDSTVLKELTKSIKDTERTIKSLNIEKEIAPLPVEEQVKMLIEEFKKVAREKLPIYKQDLRYPK